jgi:glycosyltransferase involved in cell wall biosynthesis
MTLARIYGRKNGNGSLAAVTRGFERALSKAGILAGVYGFDTDGALSDEDASTDGADAKHGVFTGWLGGVGKMFEIGRHEEHWVMIAPNSDQLPRDFVAEMKRHQEQHKIHLMAPSAWASKQVKFFLGECLTVPHGVMPEFMPRPEAAEEVRALYQAGTFRVAHFSSSDRQRKGTLELLQAWSRLNQEGKLAGARLLCVLDYAARQALREALAEGEVPGWNEVSSKITLSDRADLNPEQMAMTLRLSHLVCQPSRGEAFGLIPLEALCCGTPVAATRCTGHSEYLSDLQRGVIGILHSLGVAPIDDLPGSRAPVVDPADIARAIETAREHWPHLYASAQSRAHLWRSNWSWEASLESFIARLKTS